MNKVRVNGMVVFKNEKDFNRFMGALPIVMSPAKSEEFISRLKVDEEMFIPEFSIIIKDGIIDRSSDLNKILNLLEKNKYDLCHNTTIVRWCLLDKGISCGEFSHGVNNNRLYTDYIDFVNLFGRNIIGKLCPSNKEWDRLTMLPLDSSDRLIKMKSHMVNWCSSIFKNEYIELKIKELRKNSYRR